jgi:hypothetical protein
VDNSKIAKKGKYLLKKEYVNERSEYIDKFENQHRGDDKMAILGRSDLAVLLFATENDINGLVNYNIIKTPLKITAAKENEII